MFFNSDDSNSGVVVQPQQSFFVAALCFGFDAAYNAFLLYCVANTLAPERTKRLMIDAAWCGLEVYTVAEMCVKRNIYTIDSSLKAKYPWLTKRYWKPVNGTDGRLTEFIDDDGNTIAVDGDSDVERIRMGVCMEASEGVSFVRVMDTSIDTPYDIRHGILENAELTGEQKLTYKLMACSVTDTNGNSWDIKLTDGESYSYYVLRNVLLTRPFLKMYARRHLKGSSADSLIKALNTGNYTVSIIDNRVTQAQWKGSGKAIELHLCGPLVVNMCQSPCNVQDDAAQTESAAETKDKTI
jgi:hypothetical protein